MNKADSNDDLSPRFPIRTVAARTGLSTHLLRAWERRYEVVSPSRGTGPRLYSEADIARLRLLRTLSEAGHQIGQVARLPTDELRALVASEARRQSNSVETPRGIATESDDVMLALATLDDVRIGAILRRAAFVRPLRDFIEGVLVPVLHRTGMLWESAEMCPAHEHLLSTEVSAILDWIAEAMQPVTPARQAVAVTPSGQRHEFGVRIAALIAMQEGWQVTFLGADMPARDIATAVRLRGAEAVLLGATVNGSDGGSLVNELETLRRAVSDDVALIAGGTSAMWQRAEIEAVGVSVLESLDDLRQHLRSLSSDRRQAQATAS